MRRALRQPSHAFSHFQLTLAGQIVSQLMAIADTLLPL
jgi:hypothetical protein